MVRDSAEEEDGVREERTVAVCLLFVARVGLDGGREECMGLSNGSAGGKAEIHGVRIHT